MFYLETYTVLYSCVHIDVIQTAFKDNIYKVDIDSAVTNYALR